MSTPPLTDERLEQIRVTRDVVNRAFGFGRASATGRAINDLLDEVERLRAEVETTTGAWSRMRALHQRCESKLAIARAALERITKVNIMVHVAKDIARKALEEIQ